MGAILQNPNAKDYQKALALRLCIHLIGDIHNPLHAINYFSKSHPKSGHGGDYFFIKTVLPGHLNVSSIDLHSYWDSGMGLFYHYEIAPSSVQKDLYVRNEATKIEKLYPKKQIINNKDNSKNLGILASNWAIESYDLAVSFAYKLNENEVCSKEYTDKGKQIIQKRLAEAGYRLANFLNNIADPESKEARQ